MSHTVNEIRALVSTWTPEQLADRVAARQDILDLTDEILDDEETS